MPRSEKPSGGVPFSSDPRPTRIWTLFSHRVEGEPPTLPYTPVHTETAFLEDYVHDWTIQFGHLRYYSRITDLTQGGVWLLLEWEERKRRP